MDLQCAANTVRNYMKYEKVSKSRRYISHGYQLINALNTSSLRKFPGVIIFSSI
jgi:hypothetical protein